MNQPKNHIDNYTSNMDTLIGSIDNYKYLFEMTKCCGYGFILPVYKMYTLTEFHNIIGLELSQPITSVYLQNSNDERLEIPKNTVTVCDFINENRAWFIPIYPLPAKVVYKVFFDDGRHHIHENTTLL